MDYDQIKNLSTQELTEYLKNEDLKLMGFWKARKSKAYENSIESYQVEDDSPTRSIIYLCTLGICAYNKLSSFHDTRDFLGYVIDNLEMFLEHGNVPKEMQEYYIDVFNRGNVRFLNDFLSRYSNEEGSSYNNKRGAYTKTTAIGKALSEKEENAYVSVLLLPALLALIYIVTIVVYFLFIK